ncbi:hypothetical protein TcCL_NonESM10178 [Trypanosoma cruzi]|nr:hypothetical protein TcCL_NonESM10178 [Trypanosoma cruzi]
MEGSRLWHRTSRVSALFDRVGGALCVSSTTAEASRRLSSGERENPPTRRGGGGGCCSEERLKGSSVTVRCLQGSRSTWDFARTYFLLSVCWLALFAGGCIGPCATVNFSASVCGLTVINPLWKGENNYCSGYDDADVLHCGWWRHPLLCHVLF